MISRERIAELIEQESGCYVLNDGNIGYVHLKLKYEPELYVNGKYGYILYIYCNDRKEYKEEIFDEDLFETKEEAEWTVEFGCIERTERFEPLYYDNIDQNYCYDYHFWDKNHYGYTIRVSGKDIIWFWRNCNHREYYKNTKKEYEKLIRKCKELFLGER